MSKRSAPQSSEQPTKKAKMTAEFKQEFYTVDNFIGGKFVPPSSGQYMDITNPATGKVIGKVALSTAADVQAAQEAAAAAAVKWSALTVKSRAQIMLKIHAIIRDNTEALSELVVLEHGKNIFEARGDVMKGNETCEYATSLPQIIQGKCLEVSRGVECKEWRNARGVVASIVPFNFPAMVPFWTMPIAIGVGNTFILKPSEKVPITSSYLVRLFKEAGLPDGVVNVVNGTVEPVTAICDHPGISAVSFVGSSKVAEIVYKRCSNLNKPALAMGGAKNHLIAAPDCNVEMTAQDVVNSFSGCTGQRCMAASVLLTIGEQKELVDRICEVASSLKPGQQAARDVGPVIDQASVDRITGYINQSEERGAKILVDGRSWATEQKDGFWVGPTVILHTDPSDPALHDEIFGPVLSILVVKNGEEAIKIENGNPYGNAACIYTNSGATAQWFTKRFEAGMLGVNIGVPVPREPFSFGGIHRSKFGSFDITADGCIEFFTTRRKVTTKWVRSKDQDWMS